MRGFKLPDTTIADIKALRAKGVDGVEGFVRDGYGAPPANSRS